MVLNAGEEMGQKFFMGDCGHCVTEFGLDPWQKDEPTPLPGQDRWPPFNSPFEAAGYAVMLDAGDAGFGMGNPITGTNITRHHTNGIDWVSFVGSYAQAVDHYSDQIASDSASADSTKYWAYNGQVVKKRSTLHNVKPVFELRWERNQGAEMGAETSWAWINPSGGEGRIEWQDGSKTYANYIAYSHHYELGWFTRGKGYEWGDRRQAGVGGTGEEDNNVIQRGTWVARTNRLPSDDNLGPHLHLNIWAEYPGITNAAWQERYFDPMPEIPLFIYLTAVCLYGWTEGTFGHYSWDWLGSLSEGTATHIPSVCMAMYSVYKGNRSELADIDTQWWTLGICAQRCQSYIAESLTRDQRWKPPWGEREACTGALYHPSFYTECETHTPDTCTSCCDLRFSQFLMQYHTHAHSLGLPMESTWYYTGIYTGPRVTGYDFYGSGLANNTWQLGDYTADEIIWGMLFVWDAFKQWLGNSNMSGTCVEQWQGGPVNYSEDFCSGYYSPQGEPLK